MRDLVNIAHIALVVPTFSYLGYNIYTNQKIDSDIGLGLLITALIIAITHGYLIYKRK